MAMEVRGKPSLSKLRTVLGAFAAQLGAERLVGLSLTLGESDFEYLEGGRMRMPINMLNGSG